MSFAPACRKSVYCLLLNGHDGDCKFDPQAVKEYAPPGDQILNQYAQSFSECDIFNV